MNNRFSLRRLWLVGRWDLCVNRQFYLKMALIMFACSAAFVLLSYAFNLLSLRGMESEGVREGFICMWIALLQVCMMVSFFGHIFHNFRSRQSRIGELMLPASTAERFVWHVGFTFVVVHVLFYAAALLVDPLNYLMAKLFSDIPPKSIFMVLLGKAPEPLMFGFILNDYGTNEFANQLMGWIFVSTFALGNAWKYRNNIGLTVFCYVLLFLIVFTFASTLHNFLLRPPFPVARWMDGVILSVLFVLVWALTYRLFKRAQYITRRNP